MKVKIGGDDHDGGYYSPDTKSIVIGRNAVNHYRGDSVIIHEIQHAIQHREGFENGGNVEETAGAILQRNADREIKVRKAELEVRTDTIIAEVAKLHDQAVEHMKMIPYLKGEDRKLSEQVRDARAKRINALYAELERAENKYDDEKIKLTREATEKAENLSYDERYNYYHRLAGETEARLADGARFVQADNLRKYFYPDYSDVPRERQILWNADGSSEYHLAGREEEGSEVAEACAIGGAARAAARAAT